jgi:archaellum biogenesis protein FlaJ (TadC family)
MITKDMTSEELKAAISDDIEALKTLDVDIMPADSYYKACARLFIIVFLKLYGTVLLGFFLPFVWFWPQVQSLSEWQELLSNLAGLLLMGLGFVVFILLMMASAFSHFVLINYQLRPKLKTGELIVKKMRLSATIAYRIFAILVLIPSFFFPPGAALYTAIGAFFISGLVTGILIEMELDRIGISVLFSLVKHFFDKDKKPPNEFILKK